jgi:hypothetical protein
MLRWSMRNLHFEVQTEREVAALATALFAAGEVGLGVHDTMVLLRLRSPVALRRMKTLLKDYPDLFEAFTPPHTPGRTGRPPTNCIRVKAAPQVASEEKKPPAVGDP